MEIFHRPEVLIADPGVDDAIGLLVSAAMPGEKEFVATFGNATTEITSANYRGLEDFIHRNLQAPVSEREVFLGAEKPEADLMDFIHGERAIEGQFEGFAPATASSHVLYDRLAEERKWGIDVVSLGALREVAAVLNRPDADNIKSLTVMGGAIGVQGNIAPRVEANIGGDPKALQTVLARAKELGIPMTIIPLDVTQLPELEFTPERVEKLAESLVRRGSKNVADLLVKLVGPDATYTKFYQNKEGVFGNRPPYGIQRYQGAAMHDLTAILVKEHPELFTTVKMPIAGADNGELLIPTGWMSEYTATECNVVMDVIDPLEYWRLTEEYLARYS